MPDSASPGDDLSSPVEKNSTTTSSLPSEPSPEAVEAEVKRVLRGYDDARKISRQAAINAAVWAVDELAAYLKERELAERGEDRG